MDHRENILLIRLKSIGDILFTLPAVHQVRLNFPDAKIHFLVSAEHAPIVRGFADVNEIIPLDRSVYRSARLPAAMSATRLLRTLREKKFARVIDFQGYSETEWLAWWTGAPERWGNVYKPYRGWTYTQTSPRAPGVHPVDWNLDLLRLCGLDMHGPRNEYALPAEAGAAAQQFLARHQLDPLKPLLFIQPFSSATHKNWPLEKFIAVARYYHGHGVQVLFGGGPQEILKLEPVRAAGFAVAAGAPLLVSAGLARHAAVVFGADTGLLHFAVALGRRVVMLMNDASPGTPHPFQHPDWALTPAHKNTVSSIPVEAAIAACDRMLNAPACNASC